jgi:SAM-dependent methyltransferase
MLWHGSQWIAPASLDNPVPHCRAPAESMDSTREALLNQIRTRLRCPECASPVGFPGGATSIVCPDCRADFPVLGGGVPVLLTADRRNAFRRILDEEPGAQRMVEEYRRFGTLRERIRRSVKPPSIVYDEDLARQHSWIYDTRGLETLVLSVGGGPGRENPRVINLNLDPFEAVDIVGDALNIPLTDSSVDTVTCNAVVEHVPDPRKMTAEILRVLKPGGYAQFMIPFVFPFHAYPSDYQRYTRSGVLELMSGFETVELEVLTGPTSALLVFLREYVRLFVPGGERSGVRAAVNGVTGWLTFWLKYLDRILNRRAAASNLAAAFYYLGRKPA